MNLLQTVSPAGLRLTGEIDASNARLVERALREHGGHGPLHLDLSGISFCDVSGIRAIVSYARTRDSEHRLFLHGMPARLEKVMDVMGWVELPGLEFCACDLPA